MPENTPAEPRTMAKVQKSMAVPEDLYKLIKREEDRTGVTFTRQAVAAFLEYFLSEEFAPDPTWMNAAIALERDDVSVGEIPLMVAKKKYEQASRHLEWTRHVMKHRGHSEEEAVNGTQHLMQHVHELHNKLKAFQTIFDSSKDPLQSLITRRDERHAPYAHLDKDADHDAPSLDFHPSQRPTPRRSKPTTPDSD